MVPQGPLTSPPHRAGWIERDRVEERERQRETDEPRQEMEAEKRLASNRRLLKQIMFPRGLLIPLLKYIHKRYQRAVDRD